MNNNYISNLEPVEFPVLRLPAPNQSSGLAKMACFVIWGASNIALGVSIANKGRFSPLTASLAGLSALTFVIFVKLIALPQQIVRRDELNEMLLQLTSQLNEKHQEMLINTVQSFNEQVNDIKSEAEKNKKSTDNDFKQINKDLETLKSDIKSNKDSSHGSINLINSNLETLKSDIESNKDSSDRNIDQINANLKTLQSDIMSNKDSSDRNIDQINANLKTLQSDTKSNKDSSDESINLINSNLERLTSEIKSIEDKIEALTNTIGENKSESDKSIAQTQTNLIPIKKLNQELNEIKNKLNNFQASAQPGRNESKISDQNETIIIQDNQGLAKQAEKLKKINGKVKDLTSKVKELDSKIDLNNEHIDKNAKQTNKLISKIKSDAGKSVAALQQQIDVLKPSGSTSFNNNNNIIHEVVFDTTPSTENTLVAPRSDIREPSFTDTTLSAAPFYDSESISTDQLTDVHVQNMMSEITHYCAKMILFHTANYQGKVCTQLSQYRQALKRMSSEHHGRSNLTGYGHINPETEKKAADAIDAMIEKIDLLILDNTPTICDRPTLQLSGLAEVVKAATNKLDGLLTKFKKHNYTPEEGECLRTMGLAMQQFLLVKRIKAYVPDENQHKEFIKSLSVLEKYSSALSPSGNVWNTRAILMPLDEQKAYVQMKESASQKIKELEEDVKKMSPVEKSMINLSVELERFTQEERQDYEIKWHNDARFAYQAPDKVGTLSYEHIDWEDGTARVLNDLYNSFQKQTEAWQNLYRRCQAPQTSIAQMLSNSFAKKSGPLLENSN